MKKLSVFVFFTALLPSFSQNGKAVMQITYETRIISDTLNRQNVQQYEMILLCNATESVYYNREAKDFYTRSDKTAGIVTTAGIIPKYPKTEYSICKSDNTLTAFLPVGKYIFSFKEPDLKWEVLTDTKKCRIIIAGWPKQQVIPEMFFCLVYRGYPYSGRTFPLQRSFRNSAGSL